MTNWRPASGVEGMGGAGGGIFIGGGTGGAIVATAVTVFWITGDSPAEGVSKGVDVGTAVAWMPVEGGWELVPHAINAARMNTEPTIQILFLITKPSVSPA